LRRDPARGSLRDVFGVSLTELALIAVIMLIIVGPQKLPKLLRTVGEWIGKLRRLTTEVRAQTGIDDILRQEGIDGVHELRSILRGDLSAVGRTRRGFVPDDPYPDAVALDRSREYPLEGPDAAGALPDDLVDDALGSEPAAASLTAPPAARSPS
jgi:sec-independent protein translocase protein TatB